MDRTGEIAREADGAELQREVFGHFGGIERLQHDLAAEVVDGKVLPQAAQRALRRFGRRSVRSHHEHPRWPLAASERRDDVERREIRPMQVLEHEDEGVIGGDRFERFADFADHSLARGADGLTLQRLALFGFDERRKLQQPRRRPLCQRVDETPIVRRADQLIDRLEHRIVRFLAAESLDALPARDLKIRHQTTGASDKQIDEGGLSDPCLPGDEDELPLARIARSSTVSMRARAVRRSTNERLGAACLPIGARRSSVTGATN